MYKIEKSLPHESGNYQLMEHTSNGWETCGVYFSKKDALAALNRFKTE